MSPNVPRAPHQRGPRLFVEGLSSLGAPEVFLLDSDTSHYVRDVLRLRVGDHVEIGDKATGTIFSTHVLELDTRVRLQINEIVRTGSTNSEGATLLFALCKGDKNDLVCDWATELGCRRIIFWQSERSVVRLRSPQDIESKRARLIKIALSAAQQSRQDRPPDVFVLPSLAEALGLLPGDHSALKLTCSLSPDAELIEKQLRENSRPVCVAIGPEGDFSPEESLLLQKQGFVQVSLGEQIFRSELAAVTALTVHRVARSLL